MSKNSECRNCGYELDADAWDGLCSSCVECGAAEEPLEDEGGDVDMSN